MHENFHVVKIFVEELQKVTGNHVQAPILNGVKLEIPGESLSYKNLMDILADENTTLINVPEGGYFHSFF